MPGPVFYRPGDGFVGDVIPHVRDDEFWLYYLHDNRDPSMGTGWRLVKTRDFVAYRDAGVALSAGEVGDLDRNAYTGSLVDAEDGTYLFYTGQNPRVLGDDGEPVQSVMRAVSTDGLRTWTKDASFRLSAPSGYGSGDWRDPFVFRAAPHEPWRMLITARHVDGATRRRGVIAQYVSDDLANWRQTTPFWDPRRYIAHECPEVFQWGEWWYLVYSEFSERFATRYRVARSADGPWEVPPLDSVDGRAFYAAKTATVDGRRFFVGWIATRAGERDDGAWDWAGDMSVLEARQRPDGSLAFTLPTELCTSFARPFPPSGRHEDRGLDRTLRAPDGYEVVMSQSLAPTQFLATVTVDILEPTTECGLVIRGSEDGDEGYVLRLEPRRQRVVFDRWPRPRTGPMQWQVSGDVPYAVELERPCPLEVGRHTIALMVDGTAMVAVVDDTVAMSARMYDRTTGRLGVFVGEGAVQFHGIHVFTRD